MRNERRGAYHNEFDPFAAQWLRNLIAANFIPPGDVDERSITDVPGDDLRQYAHVHLFAGIGGWALAGRLAGWPDDRRILTGSAPCQPFAASGKRLRFDDPRHLWPDMCRLIGADRPPVVMGEQVADAVAAGWFDGVRSDLAEIDYSVRALVIPACVVNSPTRRNRLWFCATTDSGGLGRERRKNLSNWHDAAGAAAGWTQGASRTPLALSGAEAPWADAITLVGPDQRRRRAPAGISPLGHGFPGGLDEVRAYGNAINPRLGAEVMAAWLEVAP